MLVAVQTAWRLGRWRLVVLTILAVCVAFSIVVSAQAVAQANPDASFSDRWLTPQNLLTLAVLVFHFGITYQQLKALIRRVDKIEEWKDDLDKENRERAAGWFRHKRPIERDA